MIFANVSKKDLEKYSLLLGKSNDEIKKDLQEVCKDFMFISDGFFIILQMKNRSTFT